MKQRTKIIALAVSVAIVIGASVGIAVAVKNDDNDGNNLRGSSSSLVNTGELGTQNQNETGTAVNSDPGIVVETDESTTAVDADNAVFNAENTNPDPTTATADTPTADASTDSGLSPDEASEIQFLHEEEKLARDVYLTLFEQWSIQAFSNIAQSEQSHMDSMLAMIEEFDLEDPVVDDSVGAFTDPSLRQAYEDLIAKGSTSALDALLVGGYIEELDIRDLREAMAETDQSVLHDTYDRLLNASYNHLRAFVRNIENRNGGTKYQAQLLTQEDVDAIVG